MKAKGLSKTLVGGCLALLLAMSLVAAGCPPPPAEVVEVVVPWPGYPDPEFVWRMQTFVPAGTPLEVHAQRHFANMVERLSGGRMIIHSHGAGEIVPAMAVREAVEMETIEAGLWWSAFDYGVDPVGGLLGGVPFAWTLQNFPGWWWEFGGKELMQEFYDRFNIQVVGLMINPSGPAMWWTHPIATVEEMKGTVVRAVGIHAKVLDYAELGLSIKMIPGGEIYTSLELGVVEGAEFASPLLDKAFGFHFVAPYHQTPGWQEPVKPTVFIVNKDAWNELPEHLQFIIEIAARETYLHYYHHVVVYGGAKAYLKILEYSTPLRLCCADLAFFYDATMGYVTARAAECEFYARVLQSILDWEALVTPVFEELWDFAFERPEE